MTTLVEPDYAHGIALQLNMKKSQVSSAIQLFEQGNTIPFIARYRKEMTGELDENQLRDIQAQFHLQTTLYQRKCDVIRLLEEQGIFTDEQVEKQVTLAITAATTTAEVEDIYRPYRPKRKTRASVAKERGLEPLSAWFIQKERIHDDRETIVRYAAQFVNVDLSIETAEEAMSGAADIIAEMIADDADTRSWLRQWTFAHGVLHSVATDAAVESVYEVYYAFEVLLHKILPHHILALNRGEREGFLRISITLQQEEVRSQLIQRHVATRYGQNSLEAQESLIWLWLSDVVVDAYKRLLAPSIEREIRNELTDRGEDRAIEIFGANLRNLLMQPPLRGKKVLGVDPAYRTGCKLAVVDDTGKLLETAVIYPTPPQNKVEAAKKTVLDMLKQYEIDLIAIGNGTASRETETFISRCVKEYQEQSTRLVPYAMVSEAGASVYSASILAGEEFPDLDVSERSAISIGRRLQDPLAELVKIDPKSVGVGQYQHDVAQKKLDGQLSAVVESAVNQVGVDVNTASASLLSYVAGLNKTTVKNIVHYREENGRFTSRSKLAKVPRLGPKTLEQCVGFLRIPDGEEPLDATSIHPESYPAVHALLARFGGAKAIFAKPQTHATVMQELRSMPIARLSDEIGQGIPTVKDILDALERPGRDPREDVDPPLLRTDVLTVEDLEIGMVLTGTVRNVVDFGAFVDVGVKNDGLVHISQMADQFVKHPMDVVAVGDIVQVSVIQIDVQKGRLGLSMKSVAK